MMQGLGPSSGVPHNNTMAIMAEMKGEEGAQEEGLWAIGNNARAGGTCSAAEGGWCKVWGICQCLEGVKVTLKD